MISGQILYKKGFDDLKKALDEGYDKAESFSEYNNAMFMFQDMTRKIFDLFSYQNDGISFDFMKNMEEMVAMYKKGYEEFNKQLGDNIERGGNFFPASAKPQTIEEREIISLCMTSKKRLNGGHRPI